LFYTIIVFFLLPIEVLLRRPHFVVTVSGLSSIVLAFWKPLFSLLKVKIILDIRSTPVESRGLAGVLRTLMFSISVLVAKETFDGLTIITELMKDQISKRFHIDPAFVGVWTSGVSAEVFDPAKYLVEGRRLREENGLIGKFIVFHHGVLTPRRGIVETVKSMEILKSKQFDDVVLYLIGKGSALPVIRALIEKNNLEGRVVIHDVVSHADIPKYIAMGDVGIVPLPNLPDWVNQCPLNLLEYLAMEKPVIITEVPANEAVVGRNKCGIYVADADADLIANAIAYSYSQKNVLSELGSSGRAVVKNRYDWDKVAEDFEKYLMAC
jgi:glycosyltransferase involved in cell wall biosynthesis